MKIHGRQVGKTEAMFDGNQSVAYQLSDHVWFQLPELLHFRFKHQCLVVIVNDIGVSMPHLPSCFDGIAMLRQMI